MQLTFRSKIQKRAASYLAAALIISLTSLAAAQEGPEPGDRVWGKRSGSFQLSIASDKVAYTQGEPVLVTAILKNVSADPTLLTRTSPVEFYNMDVRVPIQSWIPLAPRAALTPLGRKLKDPYQTHGMGSEVPPGHESLDKFELNTLYEMSAPGEYHVVFSCRLGAPDHKSMVKIISNEIKITIADKPQ